MGLCPKPRQGTLFPAPFLLYRFAIKELKSMLHITQRWFSISKKEKETAFAVSEQVRLDAVTLLETINTTARVNELLLAGEERVALGADFNAQLRLGGTRYESVAANAGHGRLLILRMDAFLHDFHLFLRGTII